MSSSPVPSHRMTYWAAITAGTAAIVAGGWSATNTLGAARHPIPPVAAITSTAAPSANQTAPVAPVTGATRAAPRPTWSGDDGHSSSGDG